MSGKGHGIKRPDHPTGALLRGISRDYLKKQIKHLPSIFTGVPDPSVHRHKKERERAALVQKQGLDRTIREEAMKIERSRLIGMEYKDMQEAARQRVEKAMRRLDDILDNPDSSDSATLSAINMVLDRAYGKAATMNFNVNATVDAKPSELSDAELSKRIENNLRVIEGQRGTQEEVESEARPKDIRKYN